MELKVDPVSPVRSCRIPFKPDRSSIDLDGKSFVSSCITGIPASICFPAASIPMIVRSIPFTSDRFDEGRAGSSFTHASSWISAEHIKMNASISPFDASISSMTSEAMSLTHASKGKDTTTKATASSSIQIAVEVKEITAWAKEIDAGVKKIDADLEVIQTAL